MLPSSLFAQILAKCRFRRVFLRQMSLSQGSATFCFLFWIYFSCGFSAVAFSLNFSIYVVGSPLACPLGRLGPLPHPLVSLVSSNHATTLNLVQTPWNFVDEFGIAGNPNKGHSVSSQLDQTEPWQCRHIPSIFASLSHNRYSRSRARVALGRELQLPMSFPWPVFPGLDQDLFPPWFPRFLGFDSKTVQRSALCRSRRELSNEYLLAKFGFDTAENEPYYFVSSSSREI